MVAVRGNDGGGEGEVYASLSVKVVALGLGMVAARDGNGEGEVYVPLSAKVMSLTARVMCTRHLTRLPLQLGKTFSKLTSKLFSIARASSSTGLLPLSSHWRTHARTHVHTVKEGVSMSNIKVLTSIVPLVCVYL